MLTELCEKFNDGGINKIIAKISLDSIKVLYYVWWNCEARFDIILDHDGCRWMLRDESVKFFWISKKEHLHFWF